MTKLVYGTKITEESFTALEMPNILPILLCGNDVIIVHTVAGCLNDETAASVDPHPRLNDKFDKLRKMFHLPKPSWYLVQRDPITK